MAAKRLAHGPIAGGSTPRKFGWPSGKPSLPPPGAGIAKTGSFCLSTSATATSQAPLASMSGPATKTGLDAASRAPARASSESGSGAARPATERSMAARASPSSTSAPQSSIGIETNAGPLAGVFARWIARPSASGTSSARGGS